MKLALFSVPEIKIGTHNIKDPRLDQADKLVEAKKKVYAQTEVVGEESAIQADAILATLEGRSDLILKDMEFVETRLSRDPGEEEKGVLKKIQTVLEEERFVTEAGLTAEESQVVSAHGFYTNKPIVLADAGELAEPEPLIVRAVREAGFISFLTVGGKENRAWLIRGGATAWEAAGAVHSDIQKGFIRAEIIRYSDFVEAGGETGAKRAGKQRLETKGYVMEDYDVTNFRFNK